MIISFTLVWGGLSCLKLQNDCMQCNLIMALHLPEETLKQVWTSLDALCERSSFSIDAFITVGGF